MAYEIGGRSDKFGNRFEYNWIIHKLLDVAEEKISYVLIEAIGDDEQGVDLWIGNTDGSCEAQQCKARCGSEECWTFGTVNAKGVFSYWEKQLSRSENIKVSLVSPLAFTLFEDIPRRARNANLENPDMFYDFQIEKAGPKTRNLFKNICRVMKIACGTTDGNRKALDWFSRMYYRQTPDDELKTIALHRIDMLFSQDANVIYNFLLDLVLAEDSLGKNIDCVELHRMFKSNGITYRHLLEDKTIWPRMMVLNDEYRKSFVKLSFGMLYRDVTEECIDQILNGKSLIIHGNAGMGKSGCTENIIDYCLENNIPYLAIKLDKRVPEFNSKRWGENLGFPASISHCINAVSTKRKAVIILDQLDALRWTQSKSSDAIVVCSEIIDEITTINERREEPISIVVVCRTYDIEHDISIKNLFVTERKNGLQWEKIRIGVLDEHTVNQIVGYAYNDMSPRMRELLRIVSNLYIWERLSNKRFNSIETTAQLVFEWWHQLLLNANNYGIADHELETIKNEIVSFCDKKGRQVVPKAILQNKGKAVEYLVSNGILLVDENRVGFVHQSILDSFLSEIMLHCYYEGGTISEIIGERSKQTPSRRYQAQLFLQQLAAYQTADLIDVGDKLLHSDARYSIKYAFLEVLSQFEHPDEYLKDYILVKLNSSQWRRAFINTVIRRNNDFVSCLINKGVLDDWMEDSSLSVSAIDLIVSIAPNYDESAISFIKKYALLEESEDNWGNCFISDISAGSDAYFELRLSYYEKNPAHMNRVYDIKKMLSNNEYRTLKLISLILKSEVNNYEINSLLSEEDEDVLVSKYDLYFEILFPLLPTISDNQDFGNWSSKYMYRPTLERWCVQLIKNAARLMAQNEPEKLLGFYRPFMGTGNYFYNELILDSLRFFPDKYADFVISYLCESLELNSIEATSSNKSMLALAYKVISRFSSLCNIEVYKKLENYVLHFQSDKMVSRYKQRIEFNRNEAKKYGKVYWQFWGDYQLEMLPALPEKRMSKQALETLSTLKRNLKISDSWYQQYTGNSEAKNVVSPLHNKDISSNAWKTILCNPKIAQRKHSSWQERGDVYIESSLREFASAFQYYSSEHPGEAIKLILSLEEPIADEYIDAVYAGVSLSKKQDGYSLLEAEQLFERYKYDKESFRAAYICEIVEKRKLESWSSSTYSLICDIAVNHTSPKRNYPDVYSEEDKEIRTFDMLESNALNCVRGYAARTISGLLWEHADLLDLFKSTIETLTEDDNPVVRYASLWCLSPMINLDQELAVKKMIDVLEKDYRCLAAPNMRWVFCRYFEKFQSEIVAAIFKAIQSNEERLIKEAGYSIAELFMTKDAFADYIINPTDMCQKLRGFILEVLIVYLGVEKYKEKAKKILCVFSRVKTGNDFIWSRVFSEDKIDINVDKELASCILQSKINRRVIEEFSKYIDRHHYTKEYSKWLLDMCKNAVNEEWDLKTMWGVEDIIAKIVINLYYSNVEASSPEQRDVVNECLDIWDLMYEKDFGSARQLTRQLLEV